MGLFGVTFIIACLLHVILFIILDGIKIFNNKNIYLYLYTASYTSLNEILPILF